MKIYFNTLGVVTSTDTTDEAIRQGNVGNTIKAYFSGKDNAAYTARMNYTRPDGSSITNLVMIPDPTESTMFKFVLNDEWYCAVDGEATLTIYLYNGNGDIAASGQVLIPIEDTDYDDDDTVVLTQAQYNSLLAALALKLNTANGIVVLSEMPEDTSSYAEGQIFYIDGSKTFYKLTNGELVEYLIFNPEDTYVTVEEEEYQIPTEDL